MTLKPSIQTRCCYFSQAEAWQPQAHLFAISAEDMAGIQAGSGPEPGRALGGRTVVWLIIALGTIHTEAQRREKGKLPRVSLNTPYRDRTASLKDYHQAWNSASTTYSTTARTQGSIDGPAYPTLWTWHKLADMPRGSRDH